MLLINLVLKLFTRSQIEEKKALIASNRIILDALARRKESDVSNVLDERVQWLYFASLILSLFEPMLCLHYLNSRLYKFL